RLHYECARSYEFPLGDLDAALEHYQKACAISSQHVPSVAGLRRVHLLRGDWEAALEALTAEIELAEAPDERAALLFARALILEERLAQADRSRESYALALEQTPGDASILRALARASRREGDHAALRSV